MHKKLFKLTVPIFTFFFCILIIEVVLSFFYPKNNTYYVFNPGETHSYPLNTEVFRGVSDTSNIRYNSFGARSSEIPLLKHRKIIAIGGSTTECIAIDQENTWTELLQSALNKNSDSTRYWLGNFGKPANDTNHHILQTKELLQYDVLNDVETVLYLVGINDLLNASKAKEKYLNPNLFETKSIAFTVLPDSDFPYYKRTSIWKFLKKTKRVINLNQFYKEDVTKAYQESWAKRKTIKKNNHIPNLSERLEHYKKNIKTLIGMCRSKKVKPIFITQPVLWRPNISEEGENISHFFGESDLGSLDTESLYRCMTIFNDTLLKVCKENNVKCIDLAQYSKENWFYDNCHYNEKGTKEVAKVIYNYIF